MENLNKHVCNYCKQSYKNSSALTNHIKRCSEKEKLIENHNKALELLKKRHIKNTDNLKQRQQEKTNKLITKYEEKIKSLQTELELKNIILDKDKEVIDSVKHHREDISDTNKHYKELVDNAGKALNNSISTFSLIVKQCTNAPVIEAFTKFNSILDADIPKSASLFAILANKHKNKKLGKYLGEIIIKEYKKEDPFKQSLWTSDVTRFAYVVRESVNKKAIWVRDKNAQKVRKYTINPITDHIRKIMLEEREKCRKETVNLLISEEFEYIEDPSWTPYRKDREWKMHLSWSDLKRNETIMVTDQIVQNIDNHTLENEILNIITPEFCTIDDKLLIK